MDGLVFALFNIGYDVNLSNVMLIFCELFLLCRELLALGSNTRPFILYFTHIHAHAHTHNFYDCV